MGEAKRVILDTSVLIEVLDRGRIQLMGGVGEFYLSTISLHEYIRYKRDRVFFKKLEEAFEVVGLDNEVLLKAAEIFHVLKEKGLSVSENDVYVAATAITHDLELWSKDEDFEKIRRLFPELKLKLVD